MGKREGSEQRKIDAGLGNLGTLFPKTPSILFRSHLPAFRPMTESLERQKLLNLSSSCDGIKIGRSSFANAERRMLNAKRETKPVKQAKPLPLLSANCKEVNLGFFLG